MNKPKRAKSKSIAQIKINGRTYSIRATIHSLQRMKERNVDEYVVTGCIIALGHDRLLDLQKREAEAIIIDRDKGVSVVIGFTLNKIKVITVIDKSDVFVKSGTEITTI